MFNIFRKIKFLSHSPMTSFVYQLISKWYTFVAITAIVVVYWVLRGLTDAGVIALAEQTISVAFAETKAVSKYCIPKILHLEHFWHCLQHPPVYVPTLPEEKINSKNLPHLELDHHDLSKDPYSE